MATVSQNWLATLKREVALYGGPEFPLTDAEGLALFNAGAGIETAYNVCCDVANGWTLAEATAANLKGAA